MGKILVTGATGTIGTYVVRELSRRDAIIRACVHSPDRADRIRQPDVEVAALDFYNDDSVKKALDNVESAYLLTPSAPDQPEMTERFVKAAKETGVKRIVRQSALGAELDPGISLLNVHAESERIIERSGLSWTFIRPNAFMQNFVNFYGDMIRSQRKIFLPAGDGMVSFIDARDVAAVAGVVLTSGGFDRKVLELTGQEALSMESVAKTLSAETGERISYLETSREESLKSMKDAGYNEWLASGLNDLYALWKVGYASRTTSVVREITGKNPIAFRDFARDFATFFRTTLKKAM